MTASGTLREAVQAWTGLEHVFFVHSGSAAAYLALRAVLDAPAAANARSAALPALACWTLTQSILEVGAHPRYIDVDEGDLQPRSKQFQDLATDALMSVAPWGAPCSAPWTATGAGTAPHQRPAWIADLTLSPLCATDDIASVAEVVILSLGQGKPWDIGAGGIVACADDSLARTILDRLNFGRQGLRWRDRGPRIVAANALREQALSAWRELETGRDRHIEARLAWEDLSRDLPLRPVPLDQPERAGVTALIPHRLEPGLPLSSEDIHAIAIAEGLPLGVQPVSPPYREPAGADLHGKCPRAEALYDRLLFLPARAATPAFRDSLARFLDRLTDSSLSLAFPFDLPIHGATPRLPKHLATWATHGILCRALDGGFRVLDTLTSKLYAIDDTAATALAAARLEWEDDTMVTSGGHRRPEAVR